METSFIFKIRSCQQFVFRSLQKYISSVLYTVKTCMNFWVVVFQFQNISSYNLGWSLSPYFSFVLILNVCVSL